MQAKSIPPFTPEQEERFWNNVEVHHPASCWEWRGYCGSEQYGRFSVMRSGVNERFLAYRVAYHLLIGEIPDGMVLDHLCRNRRCVNPDHLQVVTLAENIRRGYGRSAVNARKTHCPRGHEFTEENTYYKPNSTSRCCRACRKEGHRRFVAKRRAIRNGETWLIDWNGDWWPMDGRAA